MYNGIGLQTARGSGTNGYVQTNRFLVKPRLSKVVNDSSSNKGFEGTAGLSRKANKDILEHDRKRQIQLNLLVLEEKLTDQGFTDSEISEKMEEKRRELEAEAEVDKLEDGEVGPMSVTGSKISDTQTHQIAARKERQMETLRAALGIGVEIQNKRYAILPSDSEDSNNEDEPANGRKKDGTSKKNLKGVVDNTSDLRAVKKSHVNESAEDTLNESSRHKKQKSGRGVRDDLSDSDENVVKRSKKRTQRKTSSDSDGKDTDAKKKKKPPPKSRSTRRHDSESSDSGSDTDSSSDSDGGREHGRSLKKGEYHKRDVKEAMKKPRKTLSSSESDQSDDDKKKKISSKRSSRSRRHDSDSSSSESDSSSSSSDSGSDGKLKKSLKKPEYDKSPGKSKRRYDSDDELVQEDRDIQSRRKSKEEQSTVRAVKVDLADRKGRRDEDSRRYKPRSYVESNKIEGQIEKTAERHYSRKLELGKYDSDSSNDSDVQGRNDQRHGKRDLEIKSLEDSHRRSTRDLNDRRKIGKEKAHGDDEKAHLERDSDGGLDTLRNLEKLYQPKEEKVVKPDGVGKEPKVSKRKMDERNWDEQPDSKSKRRNMSDLEYNDEVKHSVGGKLRSENQISDRWGAEPARDYDVVKRESGEGRERQGRKHTRDAEEDTPRINDRDRDQQQPERNRREQDDRKSSRYDRDRDHDAAKRARYDDSRSGRRYDEDDDRNGRKHSDGRHDDRRSRR